MQLTDNLERVTAALNSLCEQRGHDFSMLMVTDVVGNSSRLVLLNQPPILDDLPYPQQQDGTLQADGVVSRKSNYYPLFWAYWKNIIIKSIMDMANYESFQGIG
jgi:inorganic pyrophosphatase/exopolyphosphatase